MDSKLARIILDLIRILISICGIVVLFAKEYYIVGSMLVIIAVVFIVYLIKHAFAKQFEYHSIHHHLELDSPSGQTATWRKEVHVTPLEKNIRIWQDHLFHASGKMHFESTNIGRLVAPDQQGGEPSVTTVFDSPLEVKKKIHKVLKIRLDNCFPDNKESISWIPMHRYEEMGFHVILPKERPCRGQPKTLCFTGTSAEELHGTEVSERGLRIDILIPYPKTDAKYALFWEW